MKHAWMVAIVVATLGLGGCSSVQKTWNEAEWTKADWWGIGPGTTPGRTTLKPSSYQTNDAVTENKPVEEKAATGAHELRLSGATASAAKSAAFKAAKETCAKVDEETVMEASVVKDKAGSANGSFFHDIEFNCV